jgi:hypothetical protein
MMIERGKQRQDVQAICQQSSISLCDTNKCEGNIPEICITGYEKIVSFLSQDTKDLHHFYRSIQINLYLCTTEKNKFVSLYHCRY